MFKRKSECQKLEGMLSPYIDGQLSPAERDRLEGHIKGCDACRGELESLRATIDLFHRVPLVSPPRSFTFAEAVPQRRAVAFGALRAATAVAVIVLAFFFVGDAFHLLDGGLIAERGAPQITTDGEGVLDAGGALAEGQGYDWPVRQIELALVGMVVVLGGATAILWQRRRRQGRLGLVPQKGGGE